MKPSFQIAVSASAASLLACSALAQNPSNPNPSRPEYTHERMPGSANPNRLNDAAKASDLIGMTVNNYQDEKLGKVEEISVDVESGRIVQVILSTGGFIGIGDTLSAVPPGALHHDVAQRVLHLDADQAKLKSAPKFEMTKWADESDSAHLSEVYRHYGDTSAFTFIEKGSTAPEAPRPANADRDRNWTAEGGRTTIPVSRLASLQRVSKLTGTSVKNLQGEKLGKVENILLDLASGRVVAVVISSGGFLGLGDELSAVPPTALRFAADRTALQLDASKDQLSGAPHFRADQWPDLAQPAYTVGVYRAYRVEPYFTTNAVAADNTARNVRERSGRALTPFDQGHSAADIKTTAQIRRDIIASENMSVNGRNVKIITNEGRITLRGPVDSAEEKRLIGALASKAAASGNVDNQLEVK